MPLILDALGLAEVREHRVDELKRLVDLLADFCAGEDLKPVSADESHCSWRSSIATHDLAADEDEEDDFRLHHPVDQAREKLGLV